MDSGVREVSVLSDPYITDQLIPYIGNKRKLVPLIAEAVGRTGVSGGVFFDAFAGSGVVARYAKSAGYSVIANDWEPYAEVINQAYIAANRAPGFEGLGGMDAAFARLNALPGMRGYIASHYCPADDEHYDTERERMFYTQRNGRRIDAIRETIRAWSDEGLIGRAEEAVLLAPLIYQASYCSNTSGVFKGFHRGWGGATRTAWYRIRSHLTLKPPLLCDNGLVNEVFREDALELAPKVDCDIAYLDPPYNQHQYGANYHLLNTVALWDKPPISPVISRNGVRDKAAIRGDWRTQRRSAYCYRSSAMDAFAGLVSRLRARWIMVSYSTDGIMPVENMLACLADRGALDVVVRKYKRYRVSSQRPSARPHTTEFVAIVDVAQPGGQEQVSAVVDRIVNHTEGSDLG